LVCLVGLLGWFALVGLLGWLAAWLCCWLAGFKRGNIYYNTLF
jgi:hypothetical protein